MAKTVQNHPNEGEEGEGGGGGGEGGDDEKKNVESCMQSVKQQTPFLQTAYPEGMSGQVI